MSSLKKRLLMFAFFAPLLTVLIFIPWNDYLLIKMAITLTCGLGALELAQTFRQKFDAPFDNLFSFFLGICFPLYYFMASLVSIRLFGAALVYWAMIFAFIPILFNNRPSLGKYLHLVLGYVFILFYPSYFLALGIPLLIHLGPWVIFALIFATYANDSFAYLGGLLLGRYSFHPILVSPKKTMIGFLFGFSFSVLSSCVFYYLDFYSFLSFWQVFLLGSVIGFFAIMGDLFASALKRSMGIKDFGSLIIGRGGILDSVDSLVAVFPAVYMLFLLFGIL